MALFQDRFLEPGGKRVRGAHHFLQNARDVRGFNKNHRKVINFYGTGVENQFVLMAARQRYNQIAVYIFDHVLWRTWNRVNDNVPGILTQEEIRKVNKPNQIAIIPPKKDGLITPCGRRPFVKRRFAD